MAVTDTSPLDIAPAGALGARRRPGSGAPRTAAAASGDATGASRPPAAAGRAPAARRRASSGRHQAAALDLVRGGRSVAVATGTASGKSLCYQVPIAEAVADPIRPGTALALFPTKALAQDQLRAFAALELPGLVAATYDGDCTPEERTWVRAQRQRRAHQPRDAALRPAPAPRPLGDVPHAAALRRGRRAARAPRRVRHARRAPAAPAAPRLRASTARRRRSSFCSATIGEPARLASALCGLDRRTRSPTTAHPAANGSSRCGTRRSLDAGRRRPGVAQRDDRRPRRRARRRRGHRTHRVLPAAGRAPSSSPPT